MTSRLVACTDTTGKPWWAEPAVISDAHYQPDHRGIPIVTVTFRSADPDQAWAQHMALPELDSETAAKEYATALMHAAGQTRWEDLAGTPVWALHAKNSELTSIPAFTTDDPHQGTVTVFTANPRELRCVT